MQLVHKMLSTRGGTLAFASLAALLSAGALLTYLSRYRASVESSSEPVPVLVAKSLIEKGTPGNVVGSEELFETATVPKDEVKDGAIADPATLRGRVAADDVYPGQQLSVGDFAATTPDAIGAKLAEDQRAIAVPLDAAHGMLGNVEAGDHVDVLAGFNVRRVDARGVPVDQGEARPLLRVIMEDVVVLEAPTEEGSAAGGSKTSAVALRVDDRQAAELAFAADNGKVWIVLRPRTGGQPSTRHLVSLESLLLGVKPVSVLRSVGGRR